MRGKERKEREEKKREREGEEREKERRRRGKQCFDGRNSSKVSIFNEGCASRGRDSSYLGFFLSFELLFLVCFWDHIVSCLWHVLWY